MQRDREPVCAREGGAQAGAHERSVSHDGETPRPRPFQELERKREWSLAEHPRDKKTFLPAVAVRVFPRNCFAVGCSCRVAMRGAGGALA